MITVAEINRKAAVAQELASILAPQIVLYAGDFDEWLRDEATRDLFRKEAQLWVALGRHPFLVRADHVHEHHGRLFIGMERTWPRTPGGSATSRATWSATRHKLDGFARQESSKVQLLRKFIMLREEISEQYDPEYIIIDTSPGIRYWSINALAVANAILLSLKMDGIDIEGTRFLSKEIYSSFAKLGTQSFLLLNRIAGYCRPPTLVPQNETKPNETHSLTSTNTLYSSILNEQSSTITKLKQDMSMDVISSIPCYCDIQFDSREFLTSLKYPQHPFTQQLLDLITKLENPKLISLADRSAVRSDIVQLRRTPALLRLPDTDERPAKRRELPGTKRIDHRLLFTSPSSHCPWHPREAEAQGPTCALPRR